MKNDAADAEAIATAVRQPGMRYMEPKSLDRQSAAILLKSQQNFVLARTRLMNSMRSMLSELGFIAPQGCKALLVLVDKLADDPGGIPVDAQFGIFANREMIVQLDDKIAALRLRMREAALSDEDAMRIQTIPGIGPINAAAFRAYAPDLEAFEQGRDFAAYLGLTPRQHSTGGKQRMGRISKMGQPDTRRLLVCGAMALIASATRKGIDPNSWLARLLERMPRKKAAIVVANKMARMIWAVVVKKEEYRGNLVVYA